jgi:hypothetical protein
LNQPIRRPTSFFGPWNTDAVRKRVAEAAHAIRTANVGRNHPLDRWTNWPLIVIDKREEAYGYTEATPRAIRASAGAISRMDETLEWLSKWLNVEHCQQHGMADDAQLVVWFRARGWSWTRISSTRHETWHAQGRRPPFGNSRFAVEQIEHKALRFVANELNLANVEFREASEFAKLPPIPKQADGSAG